jgi:hypothetical protein
VWFETHVFQEIDVGQNAILLQPNAFLGQEVEALTRVGLVLKVVGFGPNPCGTDIAQRGLEGMEMVGVPPPSIRPDHGPPKPINPTQPAQKNPTRPDHAIGRAQAKILTQIKKKPSTQINLTQKI